ncbi:MAG: L-fuculose kinase, partial [Peristeroidobacter soli]
MSNASPLIAVFDVGKTNAKLALIDPALGQEVWSTRRANEVVHGEACRELDIVAIEAWLFESLRAAPGRERIAVIVPIAHGAAAVRVDRAGEVVVAPDYEDPCFEEASEEYLPLRDNYSLTFSPSLPLGLNLGRQLFYLQTRRPELFQRAAHILMYPQYWSWRLSGAMSVEVTSLGTHTDLWRPHEQAYSSLARKQGWARMMPPQRSANDRLGRVRQSVVDATGLGATCEVACGIHDSNASYLRFLMDREREAFTVVSSGTWTIVMANRGDLRRLAEQRDMLANVNAFGAPVATARYMGGREYEAIAQGGDEPTVDSVLEVMSAGAIALPSFASAGPYAGRVGRLENVEGLQGTQRAALATIYSAMMTTVLIESLGAAGEIFVDGPL